MPMRMSVGRDRADLAARLAASVAQELDQAIRERGRASLAVPGGTTPGPFLTSLGRTALPWDRVTVMPSDERWVPADHPRSNQRLVADTLLAGSARAATFVPFYDPYATPAEAARVVGDALARSVLPIDVCVLGMGDDMHTASLFPGADGLAEALDLEGDRPLLAIRAPGNGEQRITLTAPCLHGARHVHLLIQGTDKQAALDRALASARVEDAPVRIVLDRPGPTTVWYAD